MLKKAILFLWIWGMSMMQMYGQETTKEPEMLNDTIKSHPHLLLNPEFQLRIESGTLFDSDHPEFHLLWDSDSYHVEKDFSEYIRPDSFSLKDKAPLSLPPAVFKLQGLKSPLEDPLKSFLITEEEKAYLNSIHPGGLKFSAEDILRYIFWKSHRAKVKNRKRANAWKHYNTQPVY